MTEPHTSDLDSRTLEDKFQHLELQGDARASASENKSWEAIVRELEHENAALKHDVYMNALSEANTSTSNEVATTTTFERPEVHTIRQRLGCADERIETLLAKNRKLQEQAVEAHRVLAQERADRLEERNNQMMVVVAKHGLERRLRNREQDLQNEWRKNTELAERCRKLENELERSKEVGCGCGQADDTAVLASKMRDLGDLEGEDTFLAGGNINTAKHATPDYSYSKLVRWNKRMREEGRRGSSAAKRRRMQDNASLSGAPGLALAELSSVSPHPSVLKDGSIVRASTGSNQLPEQTSSGASAIDDLVTAEFKEVDSPALVGTSALQSTPAEARTMTERIRDNSGRPYYNIRGMDIGAGVPGASRTFDTRQVVSARS